MISWVSLYLPAPIRCDLGAESGPRIPHLLFTNEPRTVTLFKRSPTRLVIVLPPHLSAVASASEGDFAGRVCIKGLSHFMLHGYG